MGFEEPADLAAAVDELVAARVAGASVAPSRRRLLGGLARAAVAGVGPVTQLVVTTAGGPPLKVVVPRRPDVSHLIVARAVTATLEARAYLGPLADHVRRMSFDRSSKGLIGRTSAGEAGQVFDTFHLNADFVVASGADERFAASTDRFEGTVVHEVWHVVEAALEARSYRTTVELRRALGGLLGVATLEQATRAWAPGASAQSAAWQAAVERLAVGVSDYATTNPKEATAEMFRLWWSTSEPTAVVGGFGRLLHEILGVAPGEPPGRRNG